MTNGKLLTHLPLDRLGQSWGWKLERAENLPRVQEAVSTGRPVGVFQDAGRSEWWSAYGPWPTHFERFTSWPVEKRWEAMIVISDRLLSLPPAGLEAALLVYRPPSLTLGVTCAPGLSQEALEECVHGYFEKNRLALVCLTAIATPAELRHEPALMDFAEDRRLPLLVYADEKLEKALAATTGAELADATRAEAAALLSAGVRELAAAVLRLPGVYLAVGRRVTA